MGIEYLWTWNNRSFLLFCWEFGNLYLFTEPCVSLLVFINKWVMNIKLSVTVVCLRILFLFIILKSVKLWFSSKIRILTQSLWEFTFCTMITLQFMYRALVITDWILVCSLWILVYLLLKFNVALTSKVILRRCLIVAVVLCPMRKIATCRKHRTRYPISSQYTDTGQTCCAIHWRGTSHWNTQLPILILGSDLTGKSFLDLPLTSMYHFMMLAWWWSVRYTIERALYQLVLNPGPVGCESITLSARPKLLLPSGSNLGFSFRI